MRKARAVAPIPHPGQAASAERKRYNQAAKEHERDWEATVPGITTVEVRWHAQLRVEAEIAKQMAREREKAMALALQKEESNNHLRSFRNWVAW